MAACKAKHDREQDPVGRDERRGGSKPGGSGARIRTRYEAADRVGDL
jgi:hypothetical protein